MPNRPLAARRHSAWRPTRDDDEALAAIAEAMRTSGAAPFPTRSAALRLALHATVAHLRATGRLPAIGHREAV